ncbi:Uncharacterised protein [Mycobacterium tuberculosis]|uniref:Uncharacterized protein n=1 Tax=Mycobacterium tuberculosis TaxID=1773 RepID=A0A654TP10_MYCTX|nr:Uncharacterised protein [Mycobacterium tuberculosis]CNV37200.1 Uncharacterised protein [Mycobacterium tuberculosis]
MPVGFDGKTAVVHRNRTNHRPPWHRHRPRSVVVRDHLRQPKDQRLQVFPGCGRHAEHRPAALGDVVTDELRELAGLRHIDFVEDHRTRPCGEIAQSRVPLQRGRVAREFRFQRVDVRDGVAARLGGSAIHHMHQYSAALDVPQKVQPQTTAPGCARDQPRHVGDGERVLASRDHTEVGHQGGERVVGDLRLGRRNRRHQRGFAGRRKPDQADVGDGLEFQGEVSGLSLFAEECETGGLTHAGSQRGVAQTATASGGGFKAGARADQVGQ